MYFEDSVLYSRMHLMASDFASMRGWNQINYPWEYPIQYKKRIIIPALIFPIMSRLPPFITQDGIIIEFPDHTPGQNRSNNFYDILIELLAAALMFIFCYVLFCAFNTITTRTLSYWKEVKK